MHSILFILYLLRTRLYSITFHRVLKCWVLNGRWTTHVLSIQDWNCVSMCVRDTLNGVATKKERTFLSEIPVNTTFNKRQEKNFELRVREFYDPFLFSFVPLYVWFVLLVGWLRYRTRYVALNTQYSTISRHRRTRWMRNGAMLRFHCYLKMWIQIGTIDSLLHLIRVL